MVLPTPIYYIRTHYRDDTLSLKHIAQALFVSAPHLSRVFNSDMGVSIRDYISRVRIEHAKQMLADTQLNVGKISLAVGITDTIHFTRLFKRMTSLTPTKFREAELAKKRLS